MSLKIVALVFIYMSIIPSLSSLRILSVLPLPMRSHQIVFNALIEGLVSQGHEVVHYSGCPLTTNATNYKHNFVNTTFDELFDKFTFEFLKDFIDGTESYKPLPFQRVSLITEETLKLPQVAKLIKSNEKFDVVLLETFFSQEALLGFGHKFNAPVVTLSTLGSYSIIDSFMGNPHPVSYIPNMHFPSTCHLTFVERFKNVIKTLTEVLYTNYIHLPHQEAIMKKHFGSEMPSLAKIISNISLVLLNSQPELNYARAFLPNIIQVGGLHVKPSGKPMPKNIKKFMDEAKSGFIYFSLGSTFSGSSMPEDFNNAFVRAFSKIRERVLWKIEPPPSNLSNNVMTVSWAPQQEVLEHPNCKVFITHGGLLSFIEATYAGVPVIGIPLFADQPMNMAKVEYAGVGINLNVYNITKNSVNWALGEAIKNPKYRMNQQQLSAQMRNRLQGSPLDTAVHWVEYVAKNQGAPLLRSPARNMSSFQYLLIDVVIVIFVTLTSSIYFMYVTIKFIYNKIISPDKSSKLKVH